MHDLIADEEPVHLSTGDLPQHTSFDEPRYHLVSGFETTIKSRFYSRNIDYRVTDENLYEFQDGTTKTCLSKLLHGAVLE